MTLAGCHPMLIGLHLDHITLLDRQTARLDDEIGAALAAIPAARGIGADGAVPPDPGPASAVLPADPEARYADLGPDWHQRKTDRDRKTRTHLRGLQALGYEVTITLAVTPPNPAARAVAPAPRAP